MCLIVSMAYRFVLIPFTAACRHFAVDRIHGRDSSCRAKKAPKANFSRQRKGINHAKACGFNQPHEARPQNYRKAGFWGVWCCGLSSCISEAVSDKMTVRMSEITSSNLAAGSVIPRWNLKLRFLAKNLAPLTR